MPEVIKRVGSDFPVNRDYATIADFLADINNTAFPDSGSIAVAEIYSDSVFGITAGLVVSNSAGNVDSIIIRAAAGHQHNGVEGAGVVVRLDTSRANMVTIQNTKGTLIDFLEFDANGNINGTTIGYLIGNSTSVHTGDRTKQVLRNLLVHGGGSFRACKGVDANGRPLTVQNCIVYDIVGTGSPTSSGTSGISGDDKVDILNCTVYNVEGPSNGTTYGIAGKGSSSANIRNCVVSNISTKNSGATTDIRPGSTTQTNATSDATGTSGLTNIVAADTWVDAPNGDFTLKDGSVCIDAGTELGTTPDGIEIDIFGVDRTVINDWDIGAGDFVAVGGGGGGGEILVVDSASYVFSSPPVGLSVSQSIPVDSASFSLASSPISLSVATTLPVDSSSYIFTGFDVGVAGSETLTVDSSAYTFAASVIGLSSSTTLPVDSASYTFTDFAVGLSVAETLPVDSASYIFTPYDVNLGNTETLTVDSASYVFSSPVIGLSVSSTLLVDTSAYVFSPYAIGLGNTETIVVDSASYSFTSPPIGLRVSLTVPVDSSSYVFVGQNVVISGEVIVPITGVHVLEYPARINFSEYPAPVNLEVF